MTNYITTILVLAILLPLSFIAGCTGKESYSGDIAATECMSLCQSSKMKNIDLNTGPCLSNEIIKGWACDVAHSPRQAADNDSKNQCRSFNNGSVSHFVEVDTNCNIIRKY